MALPFLCSEMQISFLFLDASFVMHDVETNNPHLARVVTFAFAACTGRCSMRAVENLETFEKEAGRNVRHGGVFQSECVRAPG